MAGFQSLSIAFLVCVIVSNHMVVDAMTSKNMALFWGNSQSKIEGDDLQLVLDQSSGEMMSFLAFLIISPCFSEL